MSKETEPLGRAMDSRFAEYEARTKRMVRLRLVGLVLYLVIVAVVTALTVGWELEENVIVLLNLVLVVGGSLILIAIIVLPYFRPISPPTGDPGLELAHPPVNLLEPWQETVLMKVLWYILPPLLVFYVGLALFSPEEGTFLTLALTTVIFVVVTFFFGQLEVVCTSDTLSFHYGPIGKNIPIADIESIRAVSLKFGRDYLGWGIRIAPDGAVGYIAGGKTGVRIQVRAGKQYLVTVSQPQSLVNYVRAAQEAADPK